MKIKQLISLCIIVMSAMHASGQNSSGTDAISTEKPGHPVGYKHSLGASLLMISNLFPESADYYLLTYGYQPSEKNRFFAEFNTWKYEEPLGTYGNSDVFYPGYTRAYGIGIGYQRFHWKGIFTSVQATPFLKQYINEENEKIQNGFQLYLQLVAGYRFQFFNKRFYVEPAYALKYWPVDSNFPDEFAEVEEGAPNYIFEPSLNFGFKF
jgi:hypothetical protein